MEWRKITAIFRAECLEKVEQRVKEIGVRGISITKVKGCGEWEYANFFSRDWLQGVSRPIPPEASHESYRPRLRHDH